MFKELKTIEDFVRDLEKIIGVKAEFNATLNIFQAAGLDVVNSDQGACVVNRAGDKEAFKLLLDKYGVSVTPWKNFHYIAPKIVRY